ncbi:MAG: hypothetical protein AAGA54_29660 [Myxococcota bacterium]
MFACAVGLLLFGCDKAPDSAAPAAPSSASQPVATPEPVPTSHETITALAFDAGGTLYFGDSGTGKLHSVKPPAKDNPMAQAPYNLKNLDGKLAAALGTTPEYVRIRDMAVHPTTKEAYVAVGRATSDSYGSAILIVDQSGGVRMLDLSSDVAEVQIPFAPADEFDFYDEVPGRDLTFTDLEVYKGKVYVAGLSNADFASTLWSVPSSFEGQVQATKTEIYHAVHNQNETRAPIRSMKVVTFEGADYMIAAYTCTPLVAFPLNALRDGEKVTGKTIGELGYGNTPGDIVTFAVRDMQGKKSDVLFVQHKNQSAQVIGLAAIEAAVKKPGLSKPAAPGETVALGAASVPMTQLLQVDELGDQFLVAMRRDVEQGDLELVSFLKSAYFRLSDFQSEYEIPGYEYGEGQQMIKQFQDQMKASEGFGNPG